MKLEGIRPETTARVAVNRLTLLTLLVGFADFVFGTVYVTLMLRADISPSEIGLGFFVAFALSTVVEVPSGDWGDRWGQRRIASIGLVAWGVALIAFAQSANMPIVMLASLCIWSIGQALYSGAPVSLTINSIPNDFPELRTRAVLMQNVAKWAGSAAGAGAVFLGVISQIGRASCRERVF